MELVEVKGNVFEYAKKDIPLVHCIAADLRMGAGIAVQMQKKFGIRDQIKRLTRLERHAPDRRQSLALYYADPGAVPCPGCIRTGGVFNLITKRRSPGKPNYDTMKAALIELMVHVRDDKIEHIAMPRIGCGLDRLSWAQVRHIILDVFKDIDVRITVCKL